VREWVLSPGDANIRWGGRLLRLFIADGLVSDGHRLITLIQSWIGKRDGLWDILKIADLEKSTYMSERL